MNAKEKLMFGERLRKCRNESSMTQEEAAEALNISLRYYQMLERGEKIGSVDMLIAVSKMFSCSLDYLLAGVVGQTSADPIAARLNGLSPHRRQCAQKMLELWVESLENA